MVSINIGRPWIFVHGMVVKVVAVVPNTAGWCDSYQEGSSLLIDKWTVGPPNSKGKNNCLMFPCLLEANKWDGRKHRKNTIYSLSFLYRGGSIQFFIKYFYTTSLKKLFFKIKCISNSPLTLYGILTKKNFDWIIIMNQSNLCLFYVLLKFYKKYKWNLMERKNKYLYRITEK